MLSSIKTKIQNPVFLKRSAPPTRQKPEAQAAVSSTDSASLSAAAQAPASPSKPSKILLTSLLAFSALAGTAAAQTPPGTEGLVAEAVVDSTQNCCGNETVDLAKDKPEETKFGVRMNFVNDNMPTALGEHLGGPEHKTPSGDYFDDDGWTAELSLEANWQKGNTETVLGGRLMMVTERGSWDSSNTDFGGRRTDIGELVLQRNFRTELGEKGTFDYGFGGGLQAIGDLGGEGVQRWWHETAPFGGRTGDALHSNQTSDSFRVMPLVTAGAKYTHQLTEHLAFQTAAQANVPVGQGLGVVAMKAGFQGQLGPVKMELGGKLDGAWSEAPEMNFVETDGIRPGAFGSLEVEAKNLGSVYTKVETGGFRNEPIWSVGIRIGGGSSSRLSPFQ